jgi:hypothetical protein
MKKLLLVGATALVMTAGYFVAAPYFDTCLAWNGLAWANVCYRSR